MSELLKIHEINHKLHLQERRKLVKISHKIFTSIYCTKELLRFYMFRLRTVAIIRQPRFYSTVQYLKIKLVMWTATSRNMCLIINIGKVYFIIVLLAYTPNVFWPSCSVSQVINSHTLLNKMCTV